MDRSRRQGGNFEDLTFRISLLKRCLQDILVAYDSADVHLLRDQDKTFCNERFHFVIVIRIDAVWIYVFLTDFQL